jgi:hypothetical protein
MRDRSILLLLAAFTVCAFGCGGDDKAPPMGDVSGGTGGGVAPSGFCGTYCATIVATGTGCQKYNDARHCEQVCGWYRATVCTNEYSAFASCIEGLSTISCQLTTLGKVALNVPSTCNAQFTAEQDCINANNVGICPYGS